ncbi:hypothetical protein [Paracoccus ravus]|uniref:hypothetical protein n=1 Tax=Paracoccus ravus TaxID=2447760 RepID=UPI00106E205F|nr:hypothetical protein [Paracoccus ravus]
MHPAQFVSSDWAGIALGLAILMLVVILPPVARFYDASRVYLRLFAISLPMLVIGGLLIAWLLGQGLDSEVLRTMVPAIVVVLGWFVTFIFQEDRRITERREDQRDLQIALHAEIQTYADTFNAYRVADLRDSLEREIEEQGEAFRPFMTVEREPIIFLKLSTELHRLPAHQVNIAVVFYTRLQDMRGFAQELSSPQFNALPIARRRLAYLDYYAVREYVAQSAQIALREFAPPKPESPPGGGAQ